MRVLSWLALILLGALVAPAPAAAQVENDSATCQSVEGSQAVAACTRLLKLGSKQVDAYYVHVFRGVAHSNVGDQALAIEDLTKALDLDRTNARKKNHGALYHRGVAHLKNGDAKAAIPDFDAAIALDPNYVDALLARGEAHYQTSEHKLAVADYSKLIALKPRTAVYYDKRAVAHVASGDYDRAIADLSEAIRLDPRSARRRYEERADLYFKIGDCQHAIEDYTEVIKRDPKYAQAYNVRGWCHHLTHQHEGAVADATEAIKLDGRKADYYHTRGEAHRALREYDKAIVDFTVALALDPRHFDSTAGRGEAYEAKDAHAKAIEDYGRPSRLQRGATIKGTGRPNWRGGSLSSRAQQPPALGRRVALIIGNAAYHVGRGRCPIQRRTAATSPRPCAAPTASARSSRATIWVSGRCARRCWRSRLSAKGAEWAVVYYAGHGIEVDGRNYLVPVDAELKQAADVEKETLPLDWVQARLKPAGKLQLLILDACRNNPFRQRWADQGRVTGARGLARVDPMEALGLVPFEQAGLNVLVAYAAKDGEVALDGRPGENGPYARALLRYLAEPGLEVGTLFRKVRDAVLAETGKQQQPYEYGSRSGEDLLLPVRTAIAKRV